MEEKTIVCISCYYKGYDFMEEMKKLGNKIITVKSYKTVIIFIFPNMYIKTIRLSIKKAG